MSRRASFDRLRRCLEALVPLGLRSGLSPRRPRLEGSRRRGSAQASARPLCGRLRANGVSIQLLRAGFTLIEATIATVALVAVLGPLLYVLHVGRQTTSTERSSAMLACLVAAERMRADLDQMAFPDGPDAGKEPAVILSEPGPDEGSRIAFWVPKPRPQGAPIARKLELVPVHYFLRPIEGTAASYLIRRIEGADSPVAGVILGGMTFKRLRTFSGERVEDTTGTTLDLSTEATLPPDLIRVTITGVGQAASEAAMARKDARQAQSFTVSFLQSAQEPTLFFRLRAPEAGDRYQFLTAAGNLK